MPPSRSILRAGKHHRTTTNPAPIRAAAVSTFPALHHAKALVRHYREKSAETAQIVPDTKTVHRPARCLLSSQLGYIDRSFRVSHPAVHKSQPHDSSQPVAARNKCPASRAVSEPSL